jgi:2-C-methyl-D-erythritol 2,4-cyclodiphosphate synthase
MTVRSGIGYDVHRFVSDRRLVLGGVEIAHPSGLAGHSDADVVLHAIVDALLGAAALGDIGQHFPPSDPAWRDADSRLFLEHAARMVRNGGFEIANVDATVVAEEPRIGPHTPAMRRLIAETLGVDETAVSIKATTNEGMGFVGRGEGIAALAIATIRAEVGDASEPTGFVPSA